MTSRTISDEYLKLNKQLHEAPRGFGGDGDKHVHYVHSLLLEHGLRRILDYGAGQQKLSIGLQSTNYHRRIEDAIFIWNYDPAVPGIDMKPIGEFDLVTCTDVLEHIEPEFLEAVISEIFAYVRPGGFAYFVIGCLPANKHLADGRNAHLTQEPPIWWSSWLSQHPWMVIQEQFWYGKESQQPRGIPLVKKAGFLLRK